VTSGEHQRRRVTRWEPLTRTFLFAALCASSKTSLPLPRSEGVVWGLAGRVPAALRRLSEARQDLTPRPRVM